MTTERIDHAELAGNAIGRALTLAEDEEATSITHAFIANARAALALVEQQRIANLIAIYDSRSEAEAGYSSKNVDFDLVAVQIKEGPGL